MTPEEVREARLKLRLTPEQIAPLLGYGNRVRVYELENGKRSIGTAAALLLQAYLDGYRPADWPGQDKGER